MIRVLLCVCDHKRIQHGSRGCMIPRCQCPCFCMAATAYKTRFSIARYPRGRIRSKAMIEKKVEYYEAI